MIYFLILPILVVLGVGVDFLTQRTLRHFVDVERLTRLGLLLTLLWASGGWLLEASHAERVVLLVQECQEGLTEDLEALETFVHKVVGVAP